MVGATSLGVSYQVHTDQLPGSFFGPSTLVELLRHRALHQGNDAGFKFLLDGEKAEVSWTYADVDRKARAIAASLQAMDMEGERATGCPWLRTGDNTQTQGAAPMHVA